MAEGQPLVDDDTAKSAGDLLTDAAEADSNGGSSGGGGSAGGSAGSGGSGGVDAAPVSGSVIRVGIASSLGPISNSGGDRPSESEPDATPRSPEAPVSQPVLDPATQAERVISEAVARLGMTAHILRMEYSAEGVPSAGVPMHIERRGFLGLNIVVATDSAAARRLAPDLAPVGAVAGLRAGFTGRRVRTSQDRPGRITLTTLDGHQFAEHVRAGLRAGPVRDERIPDGTLERRGMRPDTSSQALREALKGFQNREARPKPTRRPPVALVVPHDVVQEMEQALPGSTVVGFESSVAGSLERATSTALDAVAALQADQEVQRAKLIAAYRRLWAERQELVRVQAGRPLSESEQVRLSEIEQSLTQITVLAHAGRLAMTQLASAEDAIYNASHDVESALRAGATTTRPGAAGELSDRVIGLEAATADAEQVGAVAESVADTAHATATQTDAQIAERTQTQPESEEPPAEVLEALETLPPELSLSNVDKDTGRFDVTADKSLLVGADRDADSAAEPQTQTPELKPGDAPKLEAPADTPIPKATAPETAPPLDDGAGAPTVTDKPEERVALPSTPQAAAPDDVSLPDDAAAEPAPGSGNTGAVASELDGIEDQKRAQLPDTDVDSAPTVPGSEPTSRQEHHTARARAAQEDEPLPTTPTSSDGETLGSDLSNDAGAAPAAPATVKTARGMAFRPGEEDTDDGGGSSTAASREKAKDPSTAPRRDDGNGKAVTPLDAAQVARDVQTHRRVASYGIELAHQDELDKSAPLRSQAPIDLADQPENEPESPESYDAVASDQLPDRGTTDQEATDQPPAPVDELAAVPLLADRVVGSDGGGAAYPASPAPSDPRSHNVNATVARSGQSGSEERRPAAPASSTRQGGRFTHVEAIGAPSSSGQSGPARSHSPTPSHSGAGAPTK